MGIGAADAHVLRTWVAGIPLTALSLRPAFGSVRTNLIRDDSLSQDPEQAEAEILQALATGRVYVADYSEGFQGGFRFAGYHGEKTLPMGTVHAGPGPVTLKAGWPEGAYLKVIHNGTMLETCSGTHWETRVDAPGVYRTEVWPLHGKKPWALSNPIYLQPLDTRAQGSNHSQ